ncbi:MAG TPA: DUF2007 domain-containing protein [Enhygromyxa sp.]|nr:DUF2007 domain-containing protein [Enhygromyxa sp.]
MADELVPLCQCWDLAEAHVIRASLEARGIPVLIEGEHHRGMMGMVGAAVTLRVMVPASQLELARELASDLIPDLAGGSHGDERELGEGLSPARRPPDEDLVDYPDDDDDALDEAEQDEAPAPRKKSLAVAALVAALGLAVGLLHIYAGQEKVGGILFVIAMTGLALWIVGQPLGLVILMGVWLVDIVRGFVLLSRTNAALERGR